MNFEPYVPFLTALATLLNTCLLIWNGRRVHRLGRRVNGMYLQTLHEAEMRGSRRTLAALADPLDVSDAKFSQRSSELLASTERGPGDSLGNPGMKTGPSTS